MSDQNTSVTARYLQFPDLKMFFHATVADADEQGNNIVMTYARRTVEDERHTAHNVKEAELQDGIDDASSNAALAKKQAASSNATSDDAIAMSKKNAADYLSLAAKVEELNREIALLHNSPTRSLKMYMSERVMTASLTEATIGDTCLVAKPFYKHGGSFDASLFYGDAYVGDKAEHHDDWHEDLADADGKVISDSGNYYRVDDTSYQTIADLSIADLLEHGHIKLIEVDVLSSSDAVLFYIYEYGTDGWINTEVLADLTASQVIDAHAVYDDTTSQDDVNIGNEINGLRGNINNEALTQWINDIADILNDLQANVAYVHDMPAYRHLHHIPLVDYNIKGDNTSSTFDYSTFDNSTFV